MRDFQVIKALYDYEPQSTETQELPFHKGDFFHVISREDDPDWYEACNPLIPAARGLVPVAFFEVIGKNERQSGGSVQSVGAKQENHDSGFSDHGPARNRSESTTNTTRSAANARSSTSIGKSSGAMVYGVVQYDFNAERPDELEAKAGEAIIVIAQSNPEWFVAKPIGRLGGPGLIPVSFIEIKDTATGQPVADPNEAVQRAGVPKVEEWKRMAADYKNSSISLGKFDAQQQMASDLGRMSLGGAGTAYSNQPSNGYVSRLHARIMQNALIFD
jgi:bud emergence protein 1